MGMPIFSIWEKILPPQPINNEFYGSPAGSYYKLLFDTISRSSGILLPTENSILCCRTKLPLKKWHQARLGYAFSNCL